tara:strand:- start:260 stop:502 length:243 start_codon:yes stop_codon:yes gene_type:complete
MTRLERVTKIVSDHLEISSRTGLSSNHNLMDDLGADSLTVIEIVMMIEEEFDVVIPDDDSEKFATINDITSWLNGALGSE